MGVRSSEGLLLSRVLQEPLWRVSSIGCMVLPRLWRVKEVVLMSTGSARWKEGKKTDARQCFHLQKKFHQISASSSHAPKLVNKSPSWVTQTLLKLLPLCWNSEHVSFCVPFKNGIFVSYSPSALLNISPTGSQSQVSCGLVFQLQILRLGSLM